MTWVTHPPSCQQPGYCEKYHDVLSPGKGEELTELLEGRVALVTGGTEGLGRAIAEAFVAESGTVIISGRSREKGQQALESINAGTSLRFMAADATNRESTEDLVDRCLADFGSIDVLVNNVGGGTGFGRAHELSDEAWDRAMVLNVKSAFWAVRRAVPAMIERGWGRIINMSSVEGKEATMAAISPYVTAKHALHGFTKAVATDYGSDGITCNAICPGKVPTESRPAGEAAAAAARMTYDQFLNHFIDATRIGRLNSAAEIAAVAVLLASELGGGVTGVAWSVDGGTASW
jgi:3-hydroxybutyrate dehydrogenase/3-oxoacyl-[acyl-carrier protein] reductase